MIKILSKEEQNKFYRIKHTGCCEFVATENEFKWSHSPKNETYVDIVCPVCGKQFYGDYVRCDENGDVFHSTVSHFPYWR